MAQLKDLIVTGPSRFVGKVNIANVDASGTFHGTLDGFTLGCSVPSGAVFTDTNTKVTSAANHYTPSADSNSQLSVDASSSTAATWNSTALVTGVNIQRDSKGHVTGVTVDSIKMPANPNTNTWRPITDTWNGDATDTSVSQKGVKAAYTAAVSDSSTYATNAKNSADAAATSASSAATSASTATSKASAAATSATNAANSASTASTKADAAATSASTASTKATAASTSATNASTYASNAKTYRDNASTYATNAKNSADAAAASAATCAAAVHIPSGGSSGQLLGWESSGKAKWVNAPTFTNKAALLKWSTGSVIATVGGVDITVSMPENPNTDVSCTKAGHYTPSAETGSALSVDASSTTAATWNSTSLVTGVNLQRDSKGHVTGVTVDSIKMPANPNTDTTYSAGTNISISNNTISSSYTVGSATSGTSYYLMGINATSGSKTTAYVSGSAYHNSGYVYALSDASLKDFENDIDVDFNQLKQIPKKYFRWKKDPEKLQIGTSAQAVQKVYPELVSIGPEGKLGVNYQHLSVIALAAIDKLHEENMELKKRLDNLEKLNK